MLEPYKSHNNIYIYKAAYNNMMNHVIIFLVLYIRIKILVENGFVLIDSFVVSYKLPILEHQE